VQCLPTLQRPADGLQVLHVFAADPLHPDWLYSYAPNGLMRSLDDGVTWTTLTTNKWPDGRDIQSPHVYVSPYQGLPAHPQALFVSSSESYGNPTATGALGFIKSIDGGATWTIAPSLEGIPVQDVAFDPSDPSHVVAVTSDVKVYQSLADGRGVVRVRCCPSRSRDHEAPEDQSPRQRTSCLQTPCKHAGRS
jgi:hypothetical protein